MRVSSCLLLIAGLLATHPATAEVVVKEQAQADLDLMIGRAEAMEDSRNALRLLERLSQEAGTNMAPRLRELAGDRSDGSGPILYRDAFLVRAATERAQILSALLAGDLDNDGSVTRDEVARVLRLGRSNGMIGDLFLRFDTDADDRVSPEELAEGVKDSVSERMAGREDRASILATLLDFDADGQITEQELNRAVAALEVRNAPTDAANQP